jgi:hypothetical protein
VNRHFDDLDAVLEFDALDDFGQLIFALQEMRKLRRMPNKRGQTGDATGARSTSRSTNTASVLRRMVA